MNMIKRLLEALEESQREVAAERLAGNIVKENFAAGEVCGLQFAVALAHDELAHAEELVRKTEQLLAKYDHVPVVFTANELKAIKSVFSDLAGKLEGL